MSQTIDGYTFINVCVLNDDGTRSAPDIYGNEIKIYPNKEARIIPGGFKNPFELLFTDPDGVEYVILREIRKYNLEDVGLNADSLVIDIGAHVGVVSMTIAKQYGCKVEAYEPAPDNYRRLVENIRINRLEGQVIPHNLAVTGDGRQVNVGGPAKENSGGMTIYEGIYKDETYTPVDSITLDQIIGDREIDLLKIDCEGAEHEILSGSLTHIKAIRGEFHTVIWDDGRFTGKDLLDEVRGFVPNIKVTL